MTSTVLVVGNTKGIRQAAFISGEAKEIDITISATAGRAADAGKQAESILRAKRSPSKVAAPWEACPTQIDQDHGHVSIAESDGVPPSPLEVTSRSPTACTSYSNARKVR